ncbi:MAG: phosphoribosylformylglycinamidine cyclo-ligase [Streptosporangiaceae bacterium]
MSDEGATYAGAGVDIAAGERAVDLMRGAVASTHRPEVVGGLGGFAGLFRLDAARYRDPLLATSSDGVGTKVAIAQALDRHDTIGVDLVAMVVDDLVACGAEPLFLTDYIVCGTLVPERVAAIVRGIADGCRTAGCALLGGETAEHPGQLGPDGYDLAGAATGVVEADALLGPYRVREGDALVALPSSGLHANGYSLVRHVLLERAGLPLDAGVDELGGASLGEVLLTPTRVHAPDCLALTRRVDVHAYAHVTGGGLEANLARVLPPHLDAVVDRASWRPPPIFGLVAECGRIERAEMERTFNLGVGMVAVVGADDADHALAILDTRGTPGRAIGTVTDGAGKVRMTGHHP